MNILKGFPSTSMNDYQLNTTTIIRHAARNFPEREIVYRDQEGTLRYNYAQAYERMKRLANVLRRLGVNPGDRVGVLDWNTHRFYESYFAIPGVGAVLLQMNMRLSPEELSYICNHSNVKVVFVAESLLSTIEAVAPQLKNVKVFVIMTNRDLARVETKLSPVYSYEELLKDADPEYDWPVIDETSAYSACYTTGTTGKPKGVYYSHRCMYLHTLTVAHYLNVSCQDVFIQIAPMFHVNGWGSIFYATFGGAKLVFPGRFTVDNLAPLVDLMIQEKVTLGCGAPPVFMPMINYIKSLKEKPDFGRARFISGATEPPLAMLRDWKEFTGAEIIHGYGATETTPLVSFNLLKPDLEEKLSEEEKWDLKRRQGLPLAGLDFRIMDPAGQELPWDGQSAGEIQIRGPWITDSYYNDSRTTEGFADGYWRSGDAGTIDSDGYLKITDRVKDLIKSGGEWISSVDLENALMGHPKVLEAAVTGVFHPKWEERPLAFVKLKDEFVGQTSKEELIDYIGSKFSKWQLPDDILFVKDIPKTSVGKFDKKLLRRQFKDYLLNSV